MVRPQPKHALRTQNATRFSSSWSRRDVTIERAIVLGLLILFIAVSRHEYIAYDAESMVAVAHNLVDHFTLKTTGAWDDYLGYSTPYSPYGIGVSVFIAPFYAVSRVVGHEEFLISLYNPIVIALTCGVVYRIGRTLQWNRLNAWIAAVSLGVLTMALQSTTELFSEPSIALCIAVVVLALLRWQNGSQWAPLALGIALALALQFRADSIATVWVSLLAVPLFVGWRTCLRPRTLVMVGGPMLVSLVLLGWYNEVRWGKLLVTSYNQSGYQTPLPHGLYGLLLSPGKSIFLFNPLAVLGVVGLGLLLWKRRPIGVLFGLLILVRAILRQNGIPGRGECVGVRACSCR
jgi:hypothetical protein